MPPRRDLRFVIVQFVILLGLAFDPVGLVVRVPDMLRWGGWAVCAVAVVFGVIAVLQLGTSFTPWPSPKAGGTLVTTGVYAYVRHPIYASLAVFAIGLALATGSAWRIGLALGLLGVFWRKAIYEEAMLREQYPGYAEYAKKVGFGL